MAKGKSAAALFEVIHGAKGVGKTTHPPDLRTPKWFKDHTEKPATPHLPPAPARASLVPSRPSSTTAPLRLTAETPAGWGPSSALSAPAADSGETAERLSRRTIAALVAVAVLGVASAFYFGRAMRSTPAPIIASETTEQLLGAPARPDVLADPVVTGAVATVLSPGIGVSEIRPEPAASAPVVVDDVNRVVGLNYVVVQSYPDVPDAQEASRLLAEAGVRTTVITNLPGWTAKNWHTVVGTRGFTRMRDNPDYASYITQIEQVSRKFAGKSRFKEFTPRPMKWKGGVPVGS